MSAARRTCGPWGRALLVCRAHNRTEHIESPAFLEKNSPFLVRQVHSVRRSMSAHERGGRHLHSRSSRPTPSGQMTGSLVLRVLAHPFSHVASLWSRSCLSCAVGCESVCRVTPSKSSAARTTLVCVGRVLSYRYSFTHARAFFFTYRTEFVSCPLISVCVP